MKYLLLKKRITTVLIIIIIFSFSILNFISSYSSIASAVRDEYTNNTDLKNLVATTDASINDNIYGKYNFVEGYGILQKLMNKNEENNFEVVKDKDGDLHYTHFAGGPNPVNDFVTRIGRLRDYVGKDTQVAVLVPPDKYLNGVTNWDNGMPNAYNNETADNYIQGVNELGIYALDFRPMIKDSGLSTTDLYYKTDHHWKVETSFMAFKYLVQNINTHYNLQLDKDGYYTNIDNYNQINYEQCYMGSQGRKTGIAYGGLDDFTLIYPKFKTSYNLDVAMHGQYEFSKTGRFEETLIDTNSLYKEDTYVGDGDKYSTYLFGNKSLVTIKNNLNPKGPKVVLIKDSFSVLLTTFLAIVYSEAQLIDFIKVRKETTGVN